MANILFVVPPLHGHVNPTVAVGGELARRGHTVGWCGYRPFLRDVLPDASAIVASDHDDGGALDEVRRRALGLRGAAALKFFFEEVVIPLADRMVPGVEEAVDQMRPDVLVVDQQTVAGAIVARRRGLPWVTSATTSAELVDPFAAMPGLRQWSDDLLVRLQVAHGIPPAGASADAVRFSPHLVLAFTVPELVGADRPWPEHWVFVGPSLAAQRGPSAPFAWPWPEDDATPAASRPPTVLVSLGTVSAEAGARFFAVAAEAVAARGARALVVAPPELVPDPPSGVVVRARIPQVALLPRMDAVVCHAGHNTVVEALSHGLPLVVAPIRDDQPVVADQVVRAGAGVRVRFGRVGAAELGDALRQVLEEPGYRAAAERVRAALTGAGGAVAAARHVEALVGAGPVPAAGGR
jgi:MGT family glycosyltransferase